MTIIHRQTFPLDGPPSRTCQNPFLTSGPNSVIEVRVLGQWRVYYRIDLPGVSAEDFRVERSQPDTSVTVSNELPLFMFPAGDPRRIPEYRTTVDLDCNCCRIEAMDLLEGGDSDGVFRFILEMDSERQYRNGVARHREQYDTIPNDRFYRRAGIVPHPYVIEYSEPQSPYYFQIANDVATVRVNMPGVPADGFNVQIYDDRVTVSGVAPAHHYDSGARTYEAIAAWLDRSDANVPTAVTVDQNASHGRILLIIRPA